MAFRTRSPWTANTPRIAVIAAAGEGRRARPATAQTPKVLLDVGGCSLLERNIRLVRGGLDINQIIVVVGRQGERIKSELGCGDRLGVKITYVSNQLVDAGLGSIFLAVRPFVDQPWLMMLGDELYVGSNHSSIRVPHLPFLAVCGLLHCDDPARIRQNYSVLLDHGIIRSVREKPTEVTNPLLGCGTYLFNPGIFHDVDMVFARRTGAAVEVADVLNSAAKRGAVLPFELTGEYVNVNTMDDWERAKRLIGANRRERGRASDHFESRRGEALR